MSRLEKATLQEVRPGSEPTPVGDPVPLQFNPDSLRLGLENRVEGGRSRGRQVRQFVGTSSTEVAFDLVFDTADEIGEGGTGRDVRERTALVERFVLPKGEQRQAPPMVQFHWGNLLLVGVISDLSIDFDLFSPDGLPLRARMGVRIREQDPGYQYLERGPGANEESGGEGTDDSGRPGEPGSDSTGKPDRTTEALEGESAAEVAAREGLDPSRWRALAPRGEDPLSLPAGTEIAYDSSLRASLSPGPRPGATASASSPDGTAEPVPRERSPAAGKALAGSGGLSAALSASAAHRADEARSRARSEFGVEPEAPGTPAARGGAGKVDRQPDPRDRTFGAGIPLRERRTFTSPGSDPVVRAHPADPPWKGLAPSAPSPLSPTGSRCRCGGTRKRGPEPRGGTPCRCT